VYADKMKKVEQKGGNAREKGRKKIKVNVKLKL
jgi:hypothetical protein